MKKTGLILVAFIILISCSADVGGVFDDIAVGDNTYFKPPGWIQGAWSDGDVTGFKFTSNDFIIKYTGGREGVSYNERINFLSTKFLSATEQISTTNYKVSILHLSINKDIYDFKYVSDSEISCTYESGSLDDWTNRTIENYILFKQ